METQIGIDKKGFLELVSSVAWVLLAIIIYLIIVLKINQYFVNAMPQFAGVEDPIIIIGYLLACLMIWKKGVKPVMIFTLHKTSIWLHILIWIWLIFIISLEIFLILFGCIGLSLYANDTSWYVN
ncbi:hypothetical protein LRS06_13930 [Hymenobacter sp. J193]|uniref:hypothetical protein n=1 Tax=Hymenobacter sp. J193 TaxID=2898429 RepID=UPI0021513E7D|nr:hypothetical protein [Hymenobacter sp. J193]MCR5888843.1 hypothetical protein [Hymenobacter sp. J193]